MNPVAESDLYIGLISGTSRDGLDAALVDLSDSRLRLRAVRCTPYPEALKTDLDALLGLGRRPTPEECADLDERLGRFFAAESLALLEDAALNPTHVAAIGSHGQTVWHEPSGEQPVSLQLGDGALMANETGLTTITQFRDADVAAGGQGAPLAPLLHRELFAEPGRTVAVLNLGGIANLTLLGPDGAVSGFDCGPANCLMDGWIQRHQGLAFDDSGRWAASGDLLPELLERLLEEPFFQQAPPRSTGLELFNQEWLAYGLGPISGGAPDVQRTLAELTVRTIIDSLAMVGGADRMLVCGGGVHNSFVMQLLADQLPGIPVESTAVAGVDPDWVEAMLFAWLAKKRLAGEALDTPPITGAAHPVLLGAIHRA